MITFAEGVTQATRNTLCAVLAVNDNVNRLFARVGADPFGFYPATAALRRQLCSDDPNNDPEYVPPFTGGQCPVAYQFRWQQRQFSGGSWGWSSTITTNLTGPISIGRASDRAPFTCNTPPATNDNNQGLFDAGGTRRAVLQNACTDHPTGWQLISLNRIDGQPDSCGNPPPVIGPPGDVIVEGDDVTYNIDESTDITVPIGFVFAPVYVDLDGSLNVPVNIDVGGLEFSGTVELSPEFNLTIKPKGFTPDPGAPDDPDGIGDPGDPGDPVGPTDEDDLPIIGVLVYADVDPDGTPSGVNFVDGPNIYVPRLASVKFAIRTENSIGWTSDLDVKNTECYVPCPAPQGAVAVRVSPMPGVTRRFTAVRGRVLTP